VDDLLIGIMYEAPRGNDCDRTGAEHGLYRSMRAVTIIKRRTMCSNVRVCIFDDAEGVLRACVIILLESCLKENKC